MNKISSIHLNGKAFNVEEGAEDSLRAYLDAANARLANDPDHAEIIRDLEQAIADKCSASLHAHKDVVTEEEMKKIIAEMGPVESNAAGQASGSSDGKTSGIPKKFYRVREGAVISGVCSGLAAYFGLDVMIVRAIFILLAFVTGGAWIFVYLGLTFFVPEAVTAEEHSAVTGAPFNANDVLMRVRAGLNGFTDKREWRRQRRAARAEFRAQRSPFAGIVSLVFAFIWVMIILSAIRAGSVLMFGGSVPFIVGLIIFIILLKIVLCPLQAWRHGSCAWNGGSYQEPTYIYARRAGAGIVDLLALVLLAYALWYLYMHVGDFRTFVDMSLVQVRSALNVR